MLRIFKNTNFSLFLGSRTIANIADSVYFMAILWMIQTSTNSVAYTGMAYSVMSAALLFSFSFGPLIDRYSPAMLASVSLLVQAFIILSIPFIGMESGGGVLILGLLFVASLFSALYYPATHTILPSISRNRDELFSGNSIIGSTDEVINLAGFLAGGSIILFIGVNQTLILSSSLLLLACLLYVVLMRRLNLSSSSPVEQFEAEDEDQRPPANIKVYLADLKEGFQFIKDNSFLRATLPLSAISNLGLAIVIIVVPSIGESFGSALHFSLLYGACFFGMILGALVSNVLKKNGVTMINFWIGEGIALMLFALMPGVFWWKLTTVVLFGICSGANTVLLTTFVQLMTRQQLLGRVMSAVSTLASISLPLGGLLGGLMAVWLDVSWIVFISAALILTSGLMLLLYKEIRKFSADDFNATKELTA
ncbi:MFS transporter [Paenibacillus lentus]|uniref:MFS transporter n=1 Tax=Paenibacillus lentus TaxID=1338368 RepID=UPI0036625414